MQQLTEQELLEMAGDYEARTGTELNTALTEANSPEEIRFIAQADGVEPRTFDTVSEVYRYMLTQLGVLGHPE